MRMQERLNQWCCPDWDCWCTMAAILLLLSVPILFFVNEISELPHYSVAINSVAGLDPDKDLGRPTLDPEFNLTLGVASRAFLGPQCINEIMKVEVSCRGVLLATSEPAKKLCAEARNHREQLVVAFGVGVHVPGFVRDSLAADIRRGVQIYDVALRFPNSIAHNVVSCGARQVGDDGSLPGPCDGL